jgi:hypothetical protein
VLLVQQVSKAEPVLLEVGVQGQLGHKELLAQLAKLDQQVQPAYGAVLAPLA